MTEEELTTKFGLLCDAVARIFYAEEFGIEGYEELCDGLIGHTSDKCRAASVAAFAALGLG